MATAQELIDALSARPVAGTGLYARGGKVPTPQQQQRPQASPPPSPRSPQSAPVAPGGTAAAILARRQAAGNLTPQAATQPPPGGGGGVLGALGGALGDVGSALGTGLRYASGVGAGLSKELVDVGIGTGEGLGFDMGPYDEDKIDHSFDFGDMFSNISQGKGFGELIVDPIMGEKGTDRHGAIKALAGFAGDVAGDPLSYLSLGGTQLAGKGGRLTAAARAIHTGQGEDVARRALKGGAFLTKSERQLLGAADAGLYLGGAKGLRIPGTTGIARGVGQATGGVRHAVTASRPWQKIFLRNSPERMENVYKVINTGKAQGGLNLTQAISVAKWDDVYRAASKSLIEPQAREAQKVLGQLDEATRKKLTHAREAGKDTDINKLLDDLWTKADEAGVDLGKRENFMPHRWRDDAAEFIAGHDIKTMKGNKVTVHRARESGATLERRLGKGVHKIGDQEVDFGEGTIAEINAALTEAFPDAGIKTWLEDDAAALVSEYINAIGHDVGVVSAFDDMLRSKAGVANPLDDVSDEVVDLVATRSKNKKQAAALKETSAIRKAEYQAAQIVGRGQAEEMQTELLRVANEQLEQFGESGVRVAAALEAGRAKGQSIAEQGENLAKIIKETREAAEKNLDRLEAEYIQLDDELQAAQVMFANTQDPKMQAQMFNAIAAEKVRLGQLIDDGIDAMLDNEKLAEQLAGLGDISRKLLSDADNPDIVQEIAQDLVPFRQKKVSRLVEQVESVADEKSVARQAATDELLTEIQSLRVQEPHLEGAYVQQGEAAVEAQRSVVEKASASVAADEENMVAASRAMTAAQQRRTSAGGAYRGRDSAVAKAEADLEQAVGMRDAVRRQYEQDVQTWQALDDAETIASRNAAPAKYEQQSLEQELFDAEEASKLAEKRVRPEKAQIRKEGRQQVEDIKSVRKEGLGDIEEGELLETQASRQEGLLRQADEKADAATLETYRVMDELWKARDDAVDLTYKLDQAKIAKEAAAGGRGPGWRGELPQGHAQAAVPDPKSSNSLIQFDTWAKLANETIPQLERRLSEARSILPAPEQAYVDALNQLRQSKQVLEKSQKVLQQIERQVDRGTRLGNPRAQRKALEAVHALKVKHADAMESFTGSYEIREDVIVDVQARLAPEAEIREKLANLPVSEPFNMRAASKPVQEAITKPSIGSRKLATITGVKDNTIEAAIDGGHVPAEVVDDFKRVQQELRDMPTGDLATAEAIDEAHRLGDFITRYDAAVKAGAEPTDELAARITREVDNKVLARDRISAKRLREALAPGETGGPRQEAAMRREFEDFVLEHAEAIDEKDAALDVFRRKRGLADPESRYQRGKQLDDARGMADAADDQKLLDQLPETPTFYDEADTAAGERALWNFQIRETEQQKLFEVEMFESALKSLGLSSEGADDLFRALTPKNSQYPGPMFYEKSAITGRLTDEAVEARKGYSSLKQAEKTALRKEEKARQLGIMQTKLDQLFEGISPTAEARLKKRLAAKLEAAESRIIKAERSATGLGGGKGKTKVTHDWRERLLGKTERGTLASRRADLETQTGYFDTAREQLVSEGEEVGQYQRDLINQMRLNQPAIEAGEQAGRDMAELPTSYREARREQELEAMTNVVDAEDAAAGALSSHDELQATLEAFDARAAKEMAEIDQAVKAEEIYEQFHGQSLAKIEADTAATKKRIKRIEGVKAGKKDFEKSFRQLDELLKEMPNSPELEPAVALHEAYHRGLLGLKGRELEDMAEQALLKAARAGSKKGGVSKDPAKNFNNVFKRQAVDGWEEVSTKLLNSKDRIAVQGPVNDALESLMVFSENGELLKAIDGMTQFFKTYATATPGFHLRNAMSATFMNMTDRVGLSNHREAVKSWKKYLADPVAYLDEIKKSDPELHSAFQATFGSGAGGNFVEAELGSAETGGRLLHNAWTNASHKLGGNVEGPVRLAAAINTTRAGGDAFQAMNRVNRLHFDYSKLSSMDRNMKRLIPFYTFLSRNLPLQMQQMAMEPKLYAAYGSALRNLGNPIEDAPEWMQGNVIGLDRPGPGSRIGLTPDLPHVGALEDVIDTVDYRDPGKAISMLNPIGVAPMEAFAGEKFRFGTEMSTKERLLHPVSQLVAPVAQTNRLTGGKVLGTDRYAGREVEKIANWLGIPVHEVTVEQMQNARKWANK